MAKSAATIVHGAWADGSSWNKVIALLLAKNMRVIAVQLPLTSVEDDLAATIIEDAVTARSQAEWSRLVVGPLG
jgi:hypothetical protein